LKLKTSPLFLLNQFCKIITLIGLGSYSTKAYSQESFEINTNTPGVIESLERLSELHKRQFEENTRASKSNVKALANLPDYKSIKIDPQFMRSIIINSDESYFKISQKDECKFLSLMENSLLRTSDGEINNIQVVFKNSTGQIEKASIPKNDFFIETYKSKCINNREYSVLFSDLNFEKTIQGIKFPIPKNNNECDNVHKGWLENSFTPYLCHINQKIKSNKDIENDIYKSKISTLNRNYINNLCSNLNSSAKFCENYLKNDIWTQVLNGEAPVYKISYKCKNLMGKTDDPTLNDLKNCASKLINDSQICITKGTKNLLSDFPNASCEDISLALGKSKLITNYHDCPGSIDNEALTNIHRIVNHFDPRKIISSKENCAGETSYTFAKLNLDIKNDAGWPLKVCYLNRISNKEECTPYIPGNRPNESLSETQVISKILYLQKGAPPKTQCKLVDSQTYNPVRTDYKYGCFIVYSAENCTTLSCSKKIIWDEKVQEDIKYIGKPVFEYFPAAYLNERYSFSHLINEVKGIQSRPIKNLTYLKFYLDNIPNSIVHGIGCLEDLIPEEYQRTSINQCQPFPFIIDGYVLRKNEIWLTFRAPTDDLHSPRFILWQNVFNAVSAFRELHPLNSWTMYGLKK
jgi:hypothetical protein